MNTPPQQPPYGQPPYGQPPAQPYGQPVYAPPPGYGPPRGTGNQWGLSSMGMEPHIAAGLGYLFGLLAIVFFFMEKRNRFVRFHNAQAILLSLAYVILFGLWLAAFFVVIVAGSSGAATDSSTANTVAGFGLILLMLCIGVVVIGYMVMWIWGLIAAFSGRVVKFPLIGAIAERWAGGPVIPAAYAPPGY